MVIEYKDPCNRRFTTLRLSLTQACNFACTYCVPQGTRLKAHHQQLSPVEFARLVRLLVSVCGIKKLRLTGGEPLVYQGLGLLLAELGEVQGVKKSITTNAVRLQHYVKPLWQAGFNSVNVSLDSLDKKTFTHMSRGGQLNKTLTGIEAAAKQGMQVKLNMVPMLLYNAAEILPILDFCLERGIECRYIELMRMGHVDQIFKENFVSMHFILNTIRKKYSLRKVPSAADSTSQRFDAGGKGIFGIIPNETAPFCQSCSRLRLSSTGCLYGCLSSTQNLAIADLLEADPETAKQRLMHILPEVMSYKQSAAFSGSALLMQSIGG